MSELYGTEAFTIVLDRLIEAEKIASGRMDDMSSSATRIRELERELADLRRIRPNDETAKNDRLRTGSELWMAVDDLVDKLDKAVLGAEIQGQLGIVRRLLRAAEPHFDTVPF